MDIVLNNVEKSFENRLVLKNINLQIKDGNWLSIIGTSGSGKSTILNLISGLLTADGGKIRIGNYYDKMEIRKFVGYLQQDFPLYPSLSVENNLKFAERKRLKIDGPSFEDVVIKLSIASCLSQIPSMLSGGERQRVALARTLLLHRPILLLDEPFSNIDVVMRRDLRRYCRELKEKWSFTVILVTHDQEDAMSTSDFVAFLDRGEIVQLESPEKMFLLPISRSVGDNVGDVGMVWFSENLIKCNRNLPIIIDIKNKGYYGFRESDFEVSNSPKNEYWNVEVIKSEFLGSRRRYFVKYNEKTFSIVSSIDHQYCKSLWILPRPLLGPAD
jgi:ABC-type sugar transport system ATPase subunit